MAIVIPLWSRNENMQNWPHYVFLHGTLANHKTKAKNETSSSFLNNIWQEILKKKPKAEIFTT